MRLLRHPAAGSSLRTITAFLAVCTAWATLALATSASRAADPRNDAPATLELLAAQADSAYQAKDWASAAPLYRRLAHEQPEGYLHWMRLGTCLHGIGENGQALQAYETAKSHGAPAQVVQYGVAIALAALGDREKAFMALTEAVQEGYGRPDLMRSHPDLASLRNDARFAPLLAQAQRNQTPCDYRNENRQFDFWVGDWDVVTTRELTPVGRSHIEHTLGDCVIWENWTSLGESGYSGKSYNIYDAELKRWEQFWVDNQGGMIHFHGALVDHVMDFYTDPIARAGDKPLTRRLRFYDLGTDRVRQLSEGSTDGGKTWAVEYDFTYRRVK